MVLINYLSWRRYRDPFLCVTVCVQKKETSRYARTYTRVHTKHVHTTHTYIQHACTYKRMYTTMNVSATHSQRGKFSLAIKPSPENPTQIDTHLHEWILTENNSQQYPRRNRRVKMCPFSRSVTNSLNNFCDNRICPHRTCRRELLTSACPRGSRPSAEWVPNCRPP